MGKNYTSVTNPGDKFGKLTVVGKPYTRRVDVRCVCGTEFSAPIGALHLGRKISCGCLLVRYAIGDIVHGRKVLERTDAKKCLLVQCMKCGKQAKIRACDPPRKCFFCEPHGKKIAANGTIYALTCPFTGEIRYVGATSVDLICRIKRHHKSKNCKRTADVPVVAWIRDLYKQGAAFGHMTLEVVTSGDMPEREIFWIKKISADGAVLLNREFNLERRPRGSKMHKPLEKKRSFEEEYEFVPWEP